MTTIKIGKPLIDLLKLCYMGNRPVLLSGRHGIGKSESLEAAAAEMTISCISRDLSLMEPPDLIGMPRVAKDVTRYSPPAFLPTTGKGILVFEELNRCPSYMRAPCLQLLTARQLNDYTLPPGWLPVAAINPPETDYEVSELDPALLSRFVQINVVGRPR
jgi:MoxR-like ATPase